MEVGSIITRTHTHACTHARTHALTHARTHARTHTHTHTHTRTHTERAWKLTTLLNAVSSFLMKNIAIYQFFLSIHWNTHTLTHTYTHTQVRSFVLSDEEEWDYYWRLNLENAKLFFLNTLYKHLEGSHTRAIILFADFSSAFTPCSHIFKQRNFSHFGLENHLVLRTIYFLTNASQMVFVNGHFSDVLLTCTGSPQGYVLSPLLYILYTYDCRSNHQDRYLVTFSDNSALLSVLQGSEQDHYPP